MLVCGSCSMRISDLKLLSFSQGEAPIPGNSIRSLSHKAYSDLPSKSSISSSHTQLKQKDTVDDDDAHTSHQAIFHDHRPITQVYPKATHAPVAENFALVCAWKEVPEIQRLFVVCATSAVGGFQVCTICTAVIYLGCLTRFPQSQFQPLKQRDAGVTLDQWMLFCRECSLGFHLNLSNSELQQCFCDARCGIRDKSELQQSVVPRIFLNLQQFTQSLVFVVFFPSHSPHFYVRYHQITRIVRRREPV